ncbi:RDD family protein [Psychrobacter sp. Ps1]|uniref:RDD family protein n=1 Tax=Psychrobacter sp. Ps1 TaxID=2790955 RepID=UPI001EE0E3EF|nr:RDD family protein [Psychrobacter sp. Ps1]MCG3841596.1 RDD family protein [Psychrobacter sp. Ps1]
MQAIMQIFLARNNVQAGPYQLEQLNIMLASGEVLLDDLMWHEGLAQWQRVGDLTNNQTVYRPTSANTPEVNDSIINNVTVFPEDTNKAKNDKSVSLDRLYGKPERPKNVKADMTTNRHQTPHNNVSLNKSTLKKAVADNDKVVGNVVLAPIMSRVLATALDWLLLIMAFLPLMLAMRKLGDMPTDLQNMEAVIKYSLSLSESIPQATQLISNAMVFGLIALQLLFIILRGQSLGKLITGIRVVDQTTHHLPSFLRLVVIRTLFLALLYIPLSTSFIVLIPLAIHYYMASKSPENIGWHDKLAKTLVVKADSSQLVKKSKSE